MGHLHTTNGVCIAISQKRRDQPRLPGQNLSDGAFWAKRRSETNRLLESTLLVQSVASAQKRRLNSRSVGVPPLRANATCRT